MDEDIQYLGTRSPHAFPTGIILRVDKSTDDPACSLTFRRTTSSVVNIGRRPSTEERIQSTSDSAMFRCPVVSRKHAKITFSDNGPVYLIDIKSHHGTHLRKVGESTSKMLTPETPAKLSDGDIITFGKSVGRNNELVRPVVARVELIYGARDPVFNPITPARQVSHIDLTSSPPRNSGRYGVYDSSDVSDNSDVEEVSSSNPASGPNALPLSPRILRNPEPSTSSLGRAFEVLKNLLPPAHIPGSQPAPLPPIRSPVVYTPSPDAEERQNPGNDFIPFFDSHSPRYSPSSPDPRSPPSWSPAPHYRGNSLDSKPHSPLHDPSYSSGSNERQPDERQSQNHSRSHSPMDLASPSPVVSKRGLSPEQLAQEDPDIVGAWPTSRSSPLVEERPVVDSSSFASEPSVINSPSQMQKAMSINSICIAQPLVTLEDLNAQLAVDDFCIQHNSSSIKAVPESNVIDPWMEDSRVVKEVEIDEVDESRPVNHASAEVKELQSSVQKLQDEISKLQIHRRKYRGHFNANVHVVANKISNLDDRLVDISAQYNRLADRIDSVVDFDLPDLQGQVDVLNVLREQIESISSSTANADPQPRLHEHPDVQKSLATLQSLVNDMQALRERTEEQMDAELCLVRDARDVALTQIAEAQAQATATATAQTRVPMTSLKRKRSDDDDEVADEECHSDSGGRTADVAVTAEFPVAIDAHAQTPGYVAVPAVVQRSHPHDEHRDAVRPAKRARRIAAVAVQTATAVTVGAIAAWSALAFS
ncbi:hypothetical protein H0H92_000271 [Tricholoma furcatifolium]|nr:hypothetical protein H0H92_000271 [Tricholoma furcatifolium]